MNSFIGWVGGKRILRKNILAQFPPEASFDWYIEVFGGAGWVLFAKDRHAKMEVFNDINGDLINLYRCVKYHSEALQKELAFSFTSREQFTDYYKQLETRGFTDIQRAARYYFIIKESYAADLHSFGVKSRNLIRSMDYLTTVSKRLNSVIIENISFEQLIRTYDREKALFYLDPPYYKAEKYYPDRFNPEDHIGLRKCLDQIKGFFILSYNDCEEIRKLYKDYQVIEVSRMDNIVVKNGKREYKELIIKNF